MGAGWTQVQFREEVKLTDGRVIVRGKLAYRLQNPEVKGGPKRADYVLYAKGNIPIAVIEAKRSVYAVGHGMQQALGYAEMLDAPTFREFVVPYYDRIWVERGGGRALHPGGSVQGHPPAGRAPRL